MMLIIKAALSAATAAMEAYSAHIQWKRETYIDDIEDEIDSIAATSSDAAGKLRIKRLLARKQRHIEQFSSVRSDGDSPD
jgi:hypothetical protein